MRARSECHLKDVVVIAAPEDRAAALQYKKFLGLLAPARSGMTVWCNLDDPDDAGAPASVWMERAQRPDVSLISVIMSVDALHRFGAELLALSTEREADSVQVFFPVYWRSIPSSAEESFPFIFQMRDQRPIQPTPDQDGAWSAYIDMLVTRLYPLSG